MTDSTPNSENRVSTKTHLAVPLRAVAIGSVIVALTSLATLAVITGVHGTGALNTVALGLAILAFVVQLIVYIVQAAAANQQLLSSQELHGATLGILAQIQEKSAGTQAAVATISEQLLTHILGKAIPEAASTGIAINAPEFAELLADRIVRRLPPSPLEALPHRLQAPSMHPSQEGERDTSEDDEIVRYMTEFPPPEEVEEVQRILERLTPDERSSLAFLARDDVTYRQPDSVGDPGFVVSPGMAAGLRELGFIERVPGAPADIYVLTPAGRKVARLYTARGEAPDYIGEGLLRFRSEEESRRNRTPRP